MRLDEIVARARKCIGHGVEYKLGCGGMVADAEWPWDAESRLDCSGFSNWCCGLSRLQNDLWLNTDNLVLDGKTPGGFFEAVPLEMALPGHLLVYGRGKKAGSYGHIGIISGVGDHGPEKAIHCSSGAWRRNQDAIAETGVEIWRIRPDSIVIRLLVEFPLPWWEAVV